MDQANLRERVEQIDDANFPMSGAEVQSYLENEGVAATGGTAFFEVIPADRQYLTKMELLADIDSGTSTDASQASLDDSL